MKNRINEYLREQAQEEIRYKEELEKNPILQYSTSQLKAELRRRKRENGWLYENQTAHREC